MRPSLVLFVFSLFCSALLGCSYVSEPLGELRPNFLNTPTPLPSPTPVGDTLLLEKPDYFIGGIQPTQMMVGVPIRFVGRTNDTYNVEIDGLPAPRIAGDSLPWSGIVAPGVYADYGLKIIPTYNEEANSLKAQGVVKLTLFKTTPVEGGKINRTDPPLVYQAVPVEWRVPLAGRVPGTTFVWQSEDQGKFTFTGSAQYSLRQLGDSLIWSGLLRDNVAATFNLRLVQIENNLLLLRGSADLTIYP